MRKLLTYILGIITLLLTAYAVFLYKQNDIHIEVNTSLAAGIIPDERLVEWSIGDTVGVPGGIPSDRAKCATVECLALENAPTSYKDGSTSATSLIQLAVNSAPAHTYVLIPSGTFLINSVINIGHSKDNVTLRGSGVGTTILDCRTYKCISVGSESDWNWKYPTLGNSITSGLTKNSTQITIADTSAISVGQLARIKVANNFSYPVINLNGHEESRSQMVRITGKTATTLSFYPPLYDTYTSQKAVIRVASQLGEYMGVEDMTIDGNNGTVTFGVWFQQTYGSWLKNVKVLRTGNYNVYFASNLNCEIRHNTIDELKRTGGVGTPNGAGLLFEVNSGCLVEDNIIRESFPNIEVNHGASGNVFAYNFINNASGLIGIDTNHGPHNQFNLYEGNLSHNLMSDGYFGSVSNDTIFRNWFTGKSSGWCVSLKRLTRNYSLVGNQLGNLDTPAMCTSYGQPNIGNGAWSGEAQLSAQDYWSNYDPVLGTNIAATLTSRTDDYHASLTLSSGTLTTGQVISLWVNGVQTAHATVKSVSGNSVSIDSSPWAKTLPTVNTLLVIWPGPGGFQELDLDVEQTTLKKGNWYSSSNNIPSAESLGGVSLPNSMYLRQKPDWFGSLSWPPFNSATPNLTYEAIPAGYRFVHGKDVPSNASVAQAPAVTPAPAPPPASGGAGASPQPSPSQTPTASVTTLAFANIKLVTEGSTYFVIKDNQRYGVTNPGILFSYGLEFKDGRPQTSSENALPYTSTLKPGDGSLVKKPNDPTVYLIFDNAKHGFTSTAIYTALGYSFSNVLEVTANELDALSLGSTISNSNIAHPNGTYINQDGTIFRIHNNQRYGIPSMEVYNSYNHDNNFNHVVPANNQDRLLPMGGVLEVRLVG